MSWGHRARSLHLVFLCIVILKKVFLCIKLFTENLLLYHVFMFIILIMKGYDKQNKMPNYFWSNILFFMEVWIYFCRMIRVVSIDIFWHSQTSAILVYCIIIPVSARNHNYFHQSRFTGSIWASVLQGWGNLACMYWYVSLSCDSPCFHGFILYSSCKMVNPLNCLIQLQ